MMALDNKSEQARAPAIKSRPEVRVIAPYPGRSSTSILTKGPARAGRNLKLFGATFPIGRVGRPARSLMRLTRSITGCTLRRATPQSRSTQATSLSLVTASGRYSRFASRATTLSTRPQSMDRTEQIAVDVDRRERVAGSAKYSLGDLASLAFDGIFAFFLSPLATCSVVRPAYRERGYWLRVCVLAARLSGNLQQGFATLALLQIGFSGSRLWLGYVRPRIGRTRDDRRRR